MRICHLTQGIVYGGGQRVAIDLCDALNRYPEFQTEVWLLGDRIHPDMPEIEGGLQVPFDGRYNRPLSVLKGARALRSQLEEHAIDLVHTHSWDADIIGAIARRGTKVKQVFHQHVTAGWLGSRALKHRIRRSITRWAFQTRDSQVVSVSEAVARLTREGLGERWGKSRTVLNGIDTGRFLPSEHASSAAGRLVIGTAARLAPMKGLEYLIDGIAMLKKDPGGLDGLQVKIAGDGSLRAALQRRIDDHGIGDTVKLIGHVSEMGKFYQSLDLFVLPSISTEGLPLTILESMACAVPVLGTSVAGIPEAVRHAMDGFVVPPGSAVAFAEAIRQLKGDRQALGEMGRSGRRRVKSEFSLERFAGEVASIYHEL